MWAATTHGSARGAEVHRALSHPVGDQFSGKLYEIGNVQCMRDVFAQVLDRSQIFMVYAPPGSGKTDVAKHLIAEHNRAESVGERKRHIFHIYCRVGIRPRNLLRRVAIAAGTAPAGEIDRILQNLLWDYRGHRVALVFDEAQHLSIECFETVRELFDQGGFSLVFTGSHELDRVFRKFAGTLEQLERRVTDKITLPSLTRNEAAGIVRSELQNLAAGSVIDQQIEMATVEISLNKKAQRYISIGRLVGALREAKRQLVSSRRSSPMNLANKDQIRALQALYTKWAAHTLDGADGDPRVARLRWASENVGREVHSFSDLTRDEKREG